MLSEREITSTLNMLRNEHLDVRTVTLGVSLFDCVSHDLDLFTANVRAKLRRYASQLVAVCDDVGDKYGIPVVNKRISVSPIAVVAAPFGPDGMVRVFRLGGKRLCQRRPRAHRGPARSPLPNRTYLLFHQRGFVPQRHQHGRRGSHGPTDP